MDFKLQKVIHEKDRVKFLEIEVFKKTNYENVQILLLEILGEYLATRGSCDSPNTWIRPKESKNEFILTCLGEK